MLYAEHLLWESYPLKKYSQCILQAPADRAVYLSEFLKMKLDNLYYLEYSDYCLPLHCYIHNILANMLFGLLQVFLIKLRYLHRTLFTKVECSNSVNHDRVQVISYVWILQQDPWPYRQRCSVYTLLSGTIWRFLVQFWQQEKITRNTYNAA